MSEPWWPKWKATVKFTAPMGGTREKSFVVRAPTKFRAEEFVCYHFESGPIDFDDYDFLNLEMVRDDPDRVPSPFAQALRGLLDDTKCFTREGWSTVLTLPEGIFNDWVSDLILPDPDFLRRILYCIDKIEDRVEMPLDKWKEILNLPSQEITPHSEEMGITLANYLLKPVYARFLRSLYPLDPGTQEMILLGMSELCHTFQMRGPREWSPRMWKEWEEKMRKAIKEKRL